MCEPNPVEIVSFHENAEVVRFLWSDDMQVLYFLKGEEWFGYAVASQTIFPLSDLSIVAPPAYPPFILESLAVFDWSERRLFLSPSGQKAIYADFPPKSGWVNATPEPGSPEANYEFPTDIFLFQEGDSNPIYVGRINYPVEQVVWFPSEERALLKTGGVGEDGMPPYLLYLMDVSAQAVQPFLSVKETQVRKIQVLDVSPDEDWALYQTSPGDHFMLKNVKDFSIVPLYQLPRSLSAGAWWLPDETSIVAFTSKELGDYAVFLYDVPSSNLAQITPDLGIKGTPYATLGISSNRVILAYADFVLAGPDALYIMDLCIQLVD